MISQKLKNIFLFNLLVIYIHGVEEVLTGFSGVDVFIKYGAHYFNTSPQQLYWVSHLTLWILLPIIYLVFNKTRYALFLFSIFGLFYIVELHHIYKAIEWGSYYPGLLTSLTYPIIGFFFLQELFKNWRKNYGRS